MRFKNLLGLLAIGGAVAYAQKKRGGDLSLAGIKNSLRGVVDRVKSEVDNMRSPSSSASRSAVGTSDLGSVGGHDEIASPTGYTQSSGFGSSNGLGTTDTGIGGSGVGRKY